MYVCVLHETFHGMYAIKKYMRPSIHKLTIWNSAKALSTGLTCQVGPGFISIANASPSHYTLIVSILCFV